MPGKVDMSQVAMDETIQAAKRGLFKHLRASCDVNLPSVQKEFRFILVEIKGLNEVIFVGSMQSLD